MKRTLNYLLSRRPALYRQVLGAIGSSNTEKKTLLRLVKDGDIVFDIGANRGDLTLLFSDIVGENGQVHAFEPVPPTVAALRERVVGECRFQNVALNDFALGDARGSTQIHVPAGDFGQASLKTHAAGSWSKPGHETFECQIRTLDEYATMEQVRRINFIKLDVEGAELLALRGAKQTLAELHPPIQLEFCAEWTAAFGYSAPELIGFLQGLGYQYFYRGDLTPMGSPVEDLAAAGGSQNVICARGPVGG